MSGNRRTRVNQALIIVYFAFVFGYPMYGWITYSGLYRWLAEFEMAHFGGYYAGYTFMAAFFTLLFGGMLVAVAAERALRLVRGEPARIAAPRAPAPRAPAPKVANPQIGTRGLLIMALVGIVVGTVAGLLGYRKSQETYAFEPLNLADGIQPRSSHVELTGTAAPSMQIQFIEKTTGETRTTVFIPLLPPQWHQGVPIVYFLRPHSDYYVGPNGTFPLSEESRAFHIQQQGVLMRNDIPGVVTTAYEKRGIKLGTPPIVLDTDTRADLDVYWIIAIMAGLMGLILLLSVSTLRIRARRARTRRATS
jgi:hypothetical protein